MKLEILIHFLKEYIDNLAGLWDQKKNLCKIHIINLDPIQLESQVDGVSK